MSVLVRQTGSDRRPRDDAGHDVAVRETRTVSYPFGILPILRTISIYGGKDADG